MTKCLKDIMVVITTCGKEEDAKILAQKLIEKRLAACAQVYGPITSYYWWEGNLEEDTEWQVKFKILKEKYEDAEKFIRQNHPYELPQIIAIPVEKSLKEYSLWVAKETNEN